LVKIPQKPDCNSEVINPLFVLFLVYRSIAEIVKKRGDIFYAVLSDMQQTIEPADRVLPELRGERDG
jgi:hypothetical protein